MGQRKKICVNCGAKVDYDTTICPTCGSTQFRRSEDDGTTILRFTSVQNTIEEDTQELPQVKKRKIVLGKKIKNRWKKWKIKAGKSLAKTNDKVEELQDKFQQLPETTKKLSLLLGAVVILLVVALIVAMLVLGGKGNEKAGPAASPTPSAQVTATPESLSATANPDGSAIGKVTILEDIINVRTSPDTESSILGIVELDTEHDVYEIRSDEDYTWYRIGAEQWIADSHDEWVKYTPNEEG